VCTGLNCLLMCLIYTGLNCLLMCLIYTGLDCLLMCLIYTGLNCLLIVSQLFQASHCLNDLMCLIYLIDLMCLNYLIVSTISFVSIARSIAQVVSIAVALS
jgi:hypothetical protein